MVFDLIEAVVLQFGQLIFRYCPRNHKFIQIPGCSDRNKGAFFQRRLLVGTIQIQVIQIPFQFPGRIVWLGHSDLTMQVTVGITILVRNKIRFGRLCRPCRLTRSCRITAAEFLRSGHIERRIAHITEQAIIIIDI